MISESNPVFMEVRGLRKSFADLVAVNNLSFNVNRGEILGFLGPNGAGKTTTISMICGLLKSDSGEIIINGRQIKNKQGSNPQTIGLCPQDLVIWESLTCYEQLVFVACSYDVPKDRAREKSQELIKALGLENKSNKMAKTLSGGMKRRLNIALALVHEPQLLILDEPQAGLDPQSRVLVRDYIRSVSDNCTVVLTTHDMDEADRLADRVAIIDNGSLLVLDTAENLKKGLGTGELLEIAISPKSRASWETLKNNLPKNLKGLTYSQGTLRLVKDPVLYLLPEILNLLKMNQIEVTDTSIRKKTLEDVFISLTGRRLRE